MDNRANVWRTDSSEPWTNWISSCFSDAKYLTYRRHNRQSCFFKQAIFKYGFSQGLCE